MFNVRRYGEIEYWLTLTKIAAVVGIALFGIILSMGGSTYPRLPGTDVNSHTLLPDCHLNGNNCVPSPGFECILP